VKRAQEQHVEDALINVGFTMVPARTVAVLEEAPGAREFCRESYLGTRKADFILRLNDRRVMPLECKVSNSATNSVKRLNNDAAVKAVGWRSDFGIRQVVLAAVLSGVYKLGNLKEAQNRGLTLFWAHELDKLIGWVKTTKAR
jgi:hypothetical protein